MADTLDVFEKRTYAFISTETWQIIKFLLEELTPVDTPDLEPEDHRCAICAENFTTDDHPPVRLPCGHVFGKDCIQEWLRPYSPFFPYNGHEMKVGANTCPMCRREFFPEQRGFDILPNIEARIKLWDKAYAHVGIALSERERQAREDLLRYIDYYEMARHNVYFYPFTWPQSTDHWADNQRKWLLECSRDLKRTNLTPKQEHLRQGLEEFARQDVPSRDDVGMVLILAAEVSDAMEERRSDR
ncbi:hypothetical protein MMC29_006194 [Sticta canariensis]|nr:hypothetical protein [Sticta canariensis]